MQVASYFKSLLGSITGTGTGAGAGAGTGAAGAGRGDAGRAAGHGDREAGPSSAKRTRDPGDDPPSMKKYKTVKSHFPKIMPSEAEEEWTAPRRCDEVRYIPIRRETEVVAGPSNRRTEAAIAPKMAPARFYERTLSENDDHRDSRKIVDRSHLARNAPSTYVLDKNRFEVETVPLRTTGELYFRRMPVYTVDDNDDDEDDDRADAGECESYVISDDEQPVTSSRIYRNRENSSTSKVEFIDLSNSDDYDVIYVKNVKSHRKPAVVETERRIKRDTVSLFPKSSAAPRPLTPNYRIFKSRNTETFKTPTMLNKVISKPIWKNNFRNRRTVMSEEKKASIAQCFRLDEKKEFEKLIKLSSSNFTPKETTLKSNKLDLRGIKAMIEKINNNKSFLEDIKVNGTNEKEEYGPYTVASINLSDSEAEAITSADDTSTTSSIRIAPINSFRQMLEDKPIASKKWIDEIRQKYSKKQTKREKEIEECTLENDLITKLNLDQWRSKTERMAKATASIPIDLIDDLEEEAFPELTEEQEEIIENALKRANPQQVLIEKFNLSIKRVDINTLSNLNWLNDEVINFYMNLLMERSQQNSDLPKVYGMNTFFYPRLMQGGHAALKRWTRKVDLFSHDLIAVPVHLGVHWCMSIIDLRNKTVRYYDSMGGNNMECCNALLKYLEEEHMDKKREKFDTAQWKKEVMKDIPQQMNGSDCGVFSCTFAEFISRNASISFSQNDMPYIRRKMVLEIVTGQLIT